MKKFFITLFFSFCVAIATNAQSVSINTDGSTADASSILDIKSTTKGMLAPRMTTAQRTTIVSPAIGLLVYDTDVKSFWYYNGTTWTNITGNGGGGSFALPFDATVNTPGVAFKIANGNTAIQGSSVNNPAIYGFSENGAGVSGNSNAGFGIFASSNQATAIRATSINTNPTILSTNSNETGTAMRGEVTGESGIGVYGVASSSTSFGVRGVNTTGAAIFGYSVSGQGVVASSINGVGLKAASINSTALEVNGNVKIAGGNTSPGAGKVLTSDMTGNATWKGPIAFRVSGNSNTIVPENMDLVALFSSESHDLSNSFNLSSSGFTVPEKGLYHFDAEISWRHDLYSNAGAALVRVRNGVTSVLAYANHYFPWEYVWEHYDFPVVNNISTDIILEAGDIIFVKISQNNPDHEDRTLMNYCSFSGHIVTRL